MRLLLIGFFGLIASTGIYAQLEKVIHQTFEIEDVSRINLDFVDDYSVEVILWAGNNIMTETQIHLYGASPVILKHFVEKEKRYELVLDNTDGIVDLYNFDKERKAIRTKNGECIEQVKLRIFVPDNFESLNDSSLTKKVKTSDGD